MVEKRASVAMFVLLLICAHTSLLAISPSAKALDAVTCCVMPETITVKLGQPFTVNVTFENIAYSGDDGVFGCQFNLTWNASILRAISMQEVAFHTATPKAEWWNIGGIKHVVAESYVIYAYRWEYWGKAVDYGYGPVKGNGSWATITLISLSPGETDLHFSDLRMGSISYIKGNGIDGKISVTNILAGDCNQDGTVDYSDAAIFSTALGASPNSAHWNSNADVNGDDAIDIYDAIILAGNYGKTT